MEPVVMNFHTGKIVRGKIETPPVEWLAVNVFAPFMDYLAQEDKRDGHAAWENEWDEVV